MSGIAAILYCNGRSASRTDIERVSRALRAYGPQKQTIRLVGPVAFAYAHFIDTPESRHAAQPVISGEGRFTMVFDGRFDNRDALATKLGLSSHRMVAISDAQLAGACWERWGQNSMSHWVGEFAVIVWDKIEGYLTAVRDHFGARTLHYNATSERIVVASAPKCIHAIGDLPRRIDQQKVADALCQLYHDSERTFFENINRVAPATLLTVAGSVVKTQKYYNFRESVRPIHYRTDAEYVEAGRELLEKSVKATLRSHLAVGAFMSGGLDSSAMSLVAAKQLEQRGKSLITYTSVPEKEWDQKEIKGFFGDEAPYAKAIGAHVPAIEINLVDGAGLGHYHKQDELLLQLEMPVRNALNLQWTHAILEKAKERGIGVMLQGVFGNATLSHSGDGVFGELLMHGSFRQLYKELSVISKSPREMFKNTLKHLVYPLGPHWLWAAKERVRGRKQPDRNWERFVAISPDFAEKMNIPNRIRDAGYDYSGGKPQYARGQWFNMIENWATNTGDIMQGLRAMYGIDIRDPFADRRIVEWSFGLPETQFYRYGVNRWLMRRMMAGHLPNSVVYNRKLGHQTADWHVRLSRDLPAIRHDIDLMKNDNGLAEVVNIRMLRDLVDDWPEETITDIRDDRFFQLQLNLPMALQIARFIQRETGSNLL